MTFLKLILITCLATGIAATCSMTEEELDASRRLAVIAHQDSTNLNCGDFRAQFLAQYVEPDAKWYNPGVGVFAGHESIDEYYQLVLPVGGGCGNALGFQTAKLDQTPMPTAIVQVGDNQYNGNFYLNAFFVAMPPFDGNSYAVESYGHYFKGHYNFTECSAKLNYYVTEDLGNEVLYVGDTLGGGQQIDPFLFCGIMSIAQTKFFLEEGFNPANVTGFNFSDAAGFPDCFGYHAFLSNRGAVCGTNLVDHTAGCFLRHIITYLSDGASPGHAKHWAKLSHGNTKCLDSCEDVLATCHASADPIPGNRVLFEEAKFEYFCTCPVGFKGDGVSACEPVSCTADSDCKPSQASFCNLDDNLCNPLETFEWDAVNGVAACHEGFKAWYNITTDQFDCIRADKCWDVRECMQQPSRVNCQYPGNLASPFGVCLCNAGYEGGYDIECTCPAGSTEQNVSPGFKVCLAPQECTMDVHCEEGLTCSSGHVNEIGQCQ